MFALPRPWLLSCPKAWQITHGNLEPRSWKLIFLKGPCWGPVSGPESNLRDPHEASVSIPRRNLRVGGSNPPLLLASRRAQAPPLPFSGRAVLQAKTRLSKPFAGHPAPTLAWDGLGLSHEMDRLRGCSPAFSSGVNSPHSSCQRKKSQSSEQKAPSRDACLLRFRW